MTPLERYDTTLDHLTKALSTLNSSVVDEPVIGHHKRLLADRLRELLSTNIALCQQLLHDHSELIGLFDKEPT